MAQPFAEPCSRGLIAAQPCPRELGREITPARRRMVLTACVLASSMAFIDGSALTVALPKLKAALGADLASVQWVVNGYVLALAALTLIGGALADAYGKARMLALGCLLFGVTSAACALAPSIAWLIAARIAQGIAGAMVGPASLALLGATYPRAERNRAIGVWAAASALTTAGGPIVGGWLTETFGWQFVFWINPPLALAALALLAAYAPEDRREARRLDMAGAAMLAAALATLAWVLSQIGSREPQATAMPSAEGPTIAAAAGFGLLGLAAYAWWERVSAHPMTPSRLVQNRPFLGLNLATLMIYASVSIMFFLLPFEIVDRCGLSATDAGLAFLPFTLGVGLLSRRFGSLADATGFEPHSSAGRGRGRRLHLDGARPRRPIGAQCDRPNDIAGPRLRSHCGAADRVCSLQCRADRRGTRVRYQQRDEPDRAARRRSHGCRHRDLGIRLRDWPRGCSRSFDCGRARRRRDLAAALATPSGSRRTIEGSRPAARAR